MLETITAYICIGACRLASGHIAFEGVSACPREIPFYTEIQVEGVGRFICLDHTHPRYNERYDLFFGFGEEARKNAIKFGKQKRRVTIL